MGNNLPNPNLIRSDTSIGNIAGKQRVWCDADLYQIAKLMRNAVWWWCDCRDIIWPGKTYNRLNICLMIFPQTSVGRHAATVMETIAGTTFWRTSSSRGSWPQGILVWSHLSQLNQEVNTGNYTATVFYPQGDQHIPYYLLYVVVFNVI